jgi:hypothetical protein
MEPPNDIKFAARYTKIFGTHGVDVSKSNEVYTVILKILERLPKAALNNALRAWIKVICPKKRFRYPYQKKNVPPWWPKDTLDFIDPYRMEPNRKSDRDTRSMIID